MATTILSESSQHASDALAVSHKPPFGIRFKACQEKNDSVADKTSDEYIRIASSEHLWKIFKDAYNGMLIHCTGIMMNLRITKSLRDGISKIKRIRYKRDRSV